MSLLPFPWNYIASLISVAAIAGGLYLYGHDKGYIAGIESRVAAENEALAKATKAAHDEQIAADKITHDVDVAAASAQIQIQTVTQTIIKKVPIYVTKEADTKFPVPCGVVRLHDSGASGAAPDTISIPAGLADDAACPFAASDLATIVVQNYGTARGWAKQLSDLQDWIGAEQRLWDKAP